MLTQKDLEAIERIVNKNTDDVAISNARELEKDFSIKCISPDGQVATAYTKSSLAIFTQGQGEITTSFELLLNTFGSPEEGDGEKTQAEWTILTPVGIATIYDWKQGDCYHGLNAGTPLEEVTEWSVGGHNKEVVGLIKKALQIK